MEIKITANSTKKEIFRLVQEYLRSKGFTIISIDDNRPWGGFLLLDESDAGKFAHEFFRGYEIKMLPSGIKLSPKILLVESGKRLSWQYHKRRAEIWRVLQGEVEIVISDTDIEPAAKLYNKGDIIQLAKGQRHRLIGLKDWGIVAEIWKHTDSNHPSDEDDIIRLKDDFGRGK